MEGKVASSPRQRDLGKTVHTYTGSSDGINRMKDFSFPINRYTELEIFANGEVDLNLIRPASASQLTYVKISYSLNEVSGEKMSNQKKSLKYQLHRFLLM